MGIGVAKKEINVDNLNLTCFFIVGRFKGIGNQPGYYRRNVQKGRFNKQFCKKIDTFIDNIAEEKERSKLATPEVESRTLGKVLFYCCHVSLARKPILL